MRKIKNRRRIIDRRDVIGIIDDLAQEHGPKAPQFRTEVMKLLRDKLEEGRETIKTRLHNGATGPNVAAAMTYLTDQIIRLVYDMTVNYVYAAHNPTQGEKISLVAVGGYGRGEMAPQSDVDLLFLYPYKLVPWAEQVVEYMLYMLWDLRLKVGHSTRSVDECIRQAKGDITIRTALLEGRPIYGDQKLWLELKERFWNEVAANTGPEFVEAKLQERDERHQRLGDSRYVLEPNLKDGKGGLRDLHTLHWITKYLYQSEDVRDLVQAGVITDEERKRFRKVHQFLWTVRFHLHYLAGRAEERVTFDLQPQLAAALNYKDHAGTSAVERFMKHYFLVAKEVGDLTRIIISALEEQHKRKARFKISLGSMRKKKLEGFTLESSRISVPDDDFFLKDPINMLRIFRVVEQYDLYIHPHAMLMLSKSVKRITEKIRRNEEANAIFMDILTSKSNPENTLRAMNECEVLGRFIPDFRRVVAQMQFDMYHVYTVDEHTIRAIGILHKIESGEMRNDMPVACEVVHKIGNRRALYVAVMLHDIAKGRGGDHSILGGEVAQELCPRLGLDKAETELVVWLVEKHLLMSNIAFRRDLDDPKAIRDFAREIQSPERLKCLLILTAADIRAVGPGVWNGWKAQLLRDLYFRAMEVLTGAHEALGKVTRIDRAKQALRAAMPEWEEEAFTCLFRQHYDSYWLCLDTEVHARHARMIMEAKEKQVPMVIQFHTKEDQSITEMSLYAQDHPGLFARATGVMQAMNISIMDARIFTTADGMALDTFYIQDSEKKPISDSKRLSRLHQAIERAFNGEINVKAELEKPPALVSRTEIFEVAPVVIVDNHASNTHTVIEVNGRDRPGFLFRMARTLTDLHLVISSAHINTFGERIVDVFYVKDIFGLKVSGDSKIERIQRRLKEELEWLAETPGENK